MAGPYAEITSAADTPSRTRSTAISRIASSAWRSKDRPSHFIDDEIMDAVQGSTFVALFIDY
jgi:hypothetical protein